jgi:hypothetical protein
LIYRDIESNLKRFEDKYGLGSSEFIQKFESVEMGDDMDFIEWDSLFDMRKRVRIG